MVGPVGKEQISQDRDGQALSPHGLSCSRPTFCEYMVM